MTFYYILITLFYLLYALKYIIIIDVLLSWFPNSYSYLIPRIIHTISDWYMGIFHDILVIGRINFTPVLGIICIEFITLFCFNFI